MKNLLLSFPAPYLFAAIITLSGVTAEAANDKPAEPPRLKRLRLPLQVQEAY